MSKIKLRGYVRSNTPTMLRINITDNPNKEGQVVTVFYPEAIFNNLQCDDLVKVTGFVAKDRIIIKSIKRAQKNYIVRALVATDNDTLMVDLVQSFETDFAGVIGPCDHAELWVNVTAEDAEAATKYVENKLGFANHGIRSVIEAREWVELFQWE